MRILVANPYLKGRERLVDEGLYPRHHLWGADALLDAGHEIDYVKEQPNPKLDRLSKKLGYRFGDIAFEKAVLKQAKEVDLLYAPAGSYFRVPLRRAQGKLACRLITWRYAPPAAPNYRKLRNLSSRSRIEGAYDGIACLTSRTELFYRAFYPHINAQYIPWTVDEQLFQPSSKAGNYAFACGRTCRDHETIARASRLTDCPIIVLAPREASRFYEDPPQNLRVVWGPDSAEDDKGIPYKNLVEYLQGAAFSIIALKPAFTTAGYTNLLESLRMGLPVVMTKGADLDINVENDGLGLAFEEGDAEDLARQINTMRTTAHMRRSAVLDYYQASTSAEDFGNRIVKFVNSVADRQEHPESKRQGSLCH